MGTSKSKKEIGKCNIAWTCPEAWLSRLAEKAHKTFGFLCGFFALGVLLQQKYSFPCFYPFVGIFLFIGATCLLSEQYYCKEMRKITDALRRQKCAATANFFMSTWGARSAGFVIAPAATVLVFCIGGCLIFGAIQLTATLVWVLILFSAVVAISIVGYLQYLCLAIYIAKLSHASERYQTLEKKQVNYVPAELAWLQKLTGLSHRYQAAFFTMGCAYITAFSGFCFWPDMEAKTNTFFFYVLWGIIFVAIVLVFPIISSLNKSIQKHNNLMGCQPYTKHRFR